MKKIMILVVMVALLVIAPVTAQNYEAQQPNSAFQSTSTLMGSGSSLSSTPTINENGTASTPSYSPAKSGPRRDPANPGTPSTPGQGQAENQFPLGDAVLPLLALACVYMVYSAARVYRRKRRV